MAFYYFVLILLVRNVARETKYLANAKALINDLKYKVSTESCRSFLSLN